MHVEEDPTTDHIGHVAEVLVIPVPTPSTACEILTFWRPRDSKGGRS